MDAILAIAAVVFTASMTEAEIERIKTEQKSKLSSFYTVGLVLSLALISNDTLVIILTMLICISIILSVIIYLKYRKEYGLTLMYVVRIFGGVVFTDLYSYKRVSEAKVNRINTGLLPLVHVK